MRLRRALPAILLVTATACHLTVTSVVTDPFDQLVPAVDGTLVVWEDYRTGDGFSDVRMRDLSGGSDTLVAGGRGDQYAPAVSASWIVWVEGDPGDIKAKHRTNGAIVTVASGAAAQYDPAVCGSLVVWTDTRNGGTDVYARDLSVGSELAVATGPNFQAYPDCSGNRVVYTSTGSHGSDIHLYDVVTRQTSVVAAEIWNEWRPAVSGDLVVWQGWPDQPGTAQGIQIYGRNLASGGSFLVTGASGHQDQPDVSGTIVAWRDARIPSDVEIFWRDLARTMTDDHVAYIQAEQTAPVLSGGRVVFQDRAAGNWDISTAPLG